MIVEEQDIFKIIKENYNVPAKMQRAREYSKTLKALFDGIDYVDELVQIDHQESLKKIEARKKYTFSIKDLATRVFSNIEAIWTAHGGSKFYDIKNEYKLKEFIDAISNVRGGKSLEQWNETFWIPVYHNDPAGVSMMIYDTEKGINPYPVNISSSKIRNYLDNGINVEWILFEPKTIKSKDSQKMHWRFIDDSFDYTIEQVNETFRVIEKYTNPFGEPPVLINSDLICSTTLDRLSPAHAIVELLQEYLRDKSIKTIFKFLQGVPLFWRYVTYCTDCTGTGVDHENNTCKSCNGGKIVGRRDVTDSIDMPVPTQDVPVLDKIAGWINPPLEIWDQYNNELELLEKTVRLTHWGAIIEDDKSNTATGRRIDLQPIQQKLHKYTKPAETREKKQSDWVYYYLNPTKPKESVSTVLLGTNYSLLSSDTALELYNNAKKEGDNSVILDDLFHQYLLSKYKNDATRLRVAIIKSEVEPYLHQSPKEVFDMFGSEKAEKKVLFEKWWGTMLVSNQTVEQLNTEYEQWFNLNKTKNESEQVIQ